MPNTVRDSIAPEPTEQDGGIPAHRLTKGSHRDMRCVRESEGLLEFVASEDVVANTLTRFQFDLNVPTKMLLVIESCEALRPRGYRLVARPFGASEQQVEAIRAYLGRESDPANVARHEPARRPATQQHASLARTRRTTTPSIALTLHREKGPNVLRRLGRILAMGVVGLAALLLVTLHG